ncbi:hypothetical protein BLOT_013714 [Blomia tropicalis]|nr:hypothetical protein BLOT_013714 [Blomia tropicalis]
MLTQILLILKRETTIDPEDLEQVMKVLAKLCSSNVWSNVQLADFTARRFEMGYSRTYSYEDDCDSQTVQHWQRH